MVFKAEIKITLGGESKNITVIERPNEFTSMLPSRAQASTFDKCSPSESVVTLPTIFSLIHIHHFLLWTCLGESLYQECHLMYHLYFHKSPISVYFHVQMPLCRLEIPSHPAVLFWIFSSPLLLHFGNTVVTFYGCILVVSVHLSCSL